MADAARLEAVRAGQRRVLWLVLVVNGAFMVVEGAGGLIFSSLALLADAAHMLSDVGALSVALVAHRLIRRPASYRHTYGLQRAEVLGALVNGLALVALGTWILIEASGRLTDPQEVAGVGLVVVAVLGLGVNVLSARMLARARGRSLNVRGAYLHMVSDAAGSLGAVGAGVAVLVADANWVDPLVSIAIGALVAWSAWLLIKETVHVLLEGTPRGIDAEEVERALREEQGIDSVHHVHIWNIASDVPALSAHVVIDDDVSLHEAQLRGDRLKVMLGRRFGIEHATFEFECHACEPAYDTERAPGHRLPAE